MEISCTLGWPKIVTSISAMVTLQVLELEPNKSGAMQKNKNWRVPIYCSTSPNNSRYTAGAPSYGTAQYYSVEQMSANTFDSFYANVAALLWMQCASHRHQCAITNSTETRRKLSTVYNKYGYCCQHEDYRQMNTVASKETTDKLCGKCDDYMPLSLQTVTPTARKKSNVHSFNSSFKRQWHVWILFVLFSRSLAACFFSPSLSPIYHFSIL